MPWRVDGVSADRDPAGIGGIQPGKDLKERRLAGAIRPEQCDELAGRDAEADLVEHFARTEPLDQPVD